MLQNSLLISYLFLGIYVVDVHFPLFLASDHDLYEDLYQVAVINVKLTIAPFNKSTVSGSSNHNQPNLLWPLDRSHIRP